jgi:hypothetical protein
MQPVMGLSDMVLSDGANYNAGEPENNFSKKMLRGKGFDRQISLSDVKLEILEQALPADHPKIKAIRTNLEKLMSIHSCRSATSGSTLIARRAGR